LYTEKKKSIYDLPWPRNPVLFTRYDAKPIIRYFGFAKPSYFYMMKKSAQQKIVFVYNANSGARNAVMDSMHKVFSPATYNCKLCDITFGVITENRTWKKFRQQSQYQMDFLHKDEFTKKYASKFGHKFEFPIVLFEEGLGFEVLISAQELNNLKTAHGLIRLLKERL